jgi:sucrose phosphorylase
MRDRVQLITYVDRLAGAGLRELQELLRGPLAGLFGGVHLLPFYDPIDGADAGFDPVDHTRVDPRLGDWEDVRALCREVDVMADVILNHVSSDSPQFRDFSARGRRSPYAGLFLTLESVFPDGATEKDLLTIQCPRPGLPFTAATLETGERRLLWTTFTSKQVDIDVNHEQGRAYLEAVLRTLGGAGIRMARLDAAAYAVKKAGGTCFMMPETFEFIGAFAARARELGIEVLAEIHSYYRDQIAIAARIDRVYDFALPPLVLHALMFRTARALREWIRIRPRNVVTVLDTHDGIGVADVAADPNDPEGRPGLLPAAEIDALVEGIHEASRGQSRLATGASAANVDFSQVNCTFYDALGRDDRAYLLARALQFFLPGVPQVYYVGLLAGENDMELLARTGVGRDINRHHYRPGDAASALEKPVVQQLLALIRLRNEHPAFQGTFALHDTTDDRLVLRWTNGGVSATLTADLQNRDYAIALS